MLPECPLCLENKRRHKSHIIPNFFRDPGGTTYPTGKSRRLQPFTVLTHTEPGKKFDKKQHGYWEKKLGLVENLLCGDCEQQLCGYESYFKTFFYGNSNPIRFSIPLKSDPFFQADYKKIKLFLLSVLWRASAASGSFFEEVSLSSRDMEYIRQLLRFENPGKDSQYFCSMSRLVPSKKLQERLLAHSISVETPSFAPTFHLFSKFSTYTFVLGGLVLTFCICRKGVPEIFKNTYIKQCGRFFLSEIEADGFIQDFAAKVLASGNVTYKDVLDDKDARKTD